MKGYILLGRIFRNIALFVVAIFILPALLHFGIWQLDGSKPQSWNTADWSSSGILPEADNQEAAIYVMAARTGKWKGGFAVHTWIVTKSATEPSYSRYDVVGWGRPVRLNAFAPDAKWYSNTPQIVTAVRGKSAERLIPQIRQAIETYPYSDHGGYSVWPGPNSNSFVAHVLNEVPELGIAPPASAVGRNYISDNSLINIDPDWLDLQVNFMGYGGFAIGRRHGIELHFMGLVAGLDILNPALKVPGFGRLPLS